MPLPIVSGTDIFIANAKIVANIHVTNDLGRLLPPNCVEHSLVILPLQRDVAESRRDPSFGKRPRKFGVEKQMIQA